LQCRFFLLIRRGGAPSGAAVFITTIGVDVNFRITLKNPIFQTNCSGSLLVLNLNPADLAPVLGNPQKREYIPVERWTSFHPCRYDSLRSAIRSEQDMHIRQIGYRDSSKKAIYYYYSKGGGNDQRHCPSLCLKESGRTTVIPRKITYIPF
jgi:hypothetical protein